MADTTRHPTDTHGTARTPMRVALTIAGSDSGGGAGIQADLKTFEAFSVFGASVITAITAQNTTGVRAVHEIPLDMVRAQLDAVLDDFDVAAIKIGMISSEAMVETLARSLRERARHIPLVLDPVMVATSGDRLSSSGAVAALISEMLPLATIVTPNSIEAGILTSSRVDDLASMRAAGEALLGMGSRWALVKGGHIAPVHRDGVPFLIDVLVGASDAHDLPIEMIDSTSTHGTGCTMSSAIAARIAHGSTIPDAVVEAQAYVRDAIARAPGLGHGHGPLGHARI